MGCPLASIDLEALLLLISALNVYSLSRSKGPSWSIPLIDRSLFLELNVFACLLGLLRLYGKDLGTFRIGFRVGIVTASRTR